MHKSSDPQVPEISENEAQKKSELLLQIQCQNRHMDHDFAGVLEFRSDPSQGIAPLADSESTFNVAAFTRFQPFKMKLLPSDRGIFRRFPKPRTVEMDAMFQPKCHVNTAFSGWKQTLNNANINYTAAVGGKDHIVIILHLMNEAEKHPYAVVNITLLRIGIECHLLCSQPLRSLNNTNADPTANSATQIIA